MDLQFWESADVKEQLTLTGVLYTAKAVLVERDGDTWRVVSDFFDPAGAKIGSSSFVASQVDGQWQAFYEAMTLDRTHRETGIAAAYVADLVVKWRALGLSRMTLNAVSGGGDNGAYTWATLGFELDPGQARLFASRMRWVGRITDRSWLELATKVASGDASITDVVDHPLGKDFLLGKYGTVQWAGVYEITP